MNRISNPTASDPQVNHGEVANGVLNILASYSQHLPPTRYHSQRGDQGQSPSTPRRGRLLFKERVKAQVEKDEPVQMVMPAFPFKSSNTVDKVIGTLPDLGEVLALSRLNAMCEEIRHIYPRGAELTIAADGFVFNDVAGVSDEITWAYSEAIVSIIREKGFTRNIKFVRLSDLLGMHTNPLDQETCLSLAATSRNQLVAQYGVSKKEICKMIHADEDSMLTYRGLKKFFEKDLRYTDIAKSAKTRREYVTCAKKVAREVMMRAESFTRLIADRRPDAVRLSIHRSRGTVKISIPLVEVGSDIQISSSRRIFPRSPWHSVVAVDAAGNYSTVHREDVCGEGGTHTLVRSRDGRPYYYREKSPLWDDEAVWGEEQEEVVFEPVYPHDLHVYPRRPSSTETMLSEEQIARLRALAQQYRGELVVSGFTNAAAVFPTLVKEGHQRALVPHGNRCQYSYLEHSVPEALL